MSAPSTQPIDRTVAGLTAVEAARRHADQGPNELPRARPPGITRRAVRQLADPMSVLLLLAGAGTLLVLRDLPEGIAIIAILVINTVVGVTQESRADKAVLALRRLTSPSATVFRDGVLQRIPADDIVTGDLLALNAGDRVAADAVLASEQSIGIDESALTGESATVSKIVGGPRDDAYPLGDRTGAVFAGTVVVRGSGTATVHRIGAHTEIGRIAATVAQRPKAPLEIELGRVTRRVGVLAAAIGAVVIIIGLTRVSRGEAVILDVILAGVAMAIAAVPESLAAAVTAALALGAQRMARLGVIVRSLSAIETLGATSVIASDKTGTLTTGRLTVAELVLPTSLPALTAEDTIWRSAVLCTDARDGVGDAVDVAIIAAARRRDVEPDHRSRTASRPFDAQTRSMTVLNEGPLLTVKGAPEVVLARCRNGADREELAEAVPALAARGLRVIAVAQGDTDDLDADGLRPLGLIALSDELRPSAADAVADCRTAGIKVVLITGDHPDTAQALAGAVGLEPGPVVTGSQLASITDPSRRAALLREATVIARVDPETKLELVRAYQHVGRIVTMTGDGVNDAPALRNADAGIAIAGEQGTDVAREAADVIVTNGELSTIVTGVREGRRLFGSVRSMVGYLLAGNVSESFLIIIGLFLWPDLVVPLLPVHLLWINLVTDGIPALALGSDQQPGDPLDGRPRPRHGGLLDHRRLAELGIRAAIIAGLLIGSGELVRRLGWNDAQLRTQLVLGLVFAHVLLAYVTRARRWTFERGWWRAAGLRYAVLTSLVVQAILVLVPGLGSPLGLVPLPWQGWLIAGSVCLLTVVLCDLVRQRRTDFGH